MTNPKIILCVFLFFNIQFCFSQSGEFQFQWAKRIGNSAYQYQGKSLFPDKSGNIYCAGDATDLITRNGFFSKFDSAGTLKWQLFLGKYGNSILNDDSGFVYLSGIFSNSIILGLGAGKDTITALNNYDMFIAKFDTAKKYYWIKRLGGSPASITNSRHDLAYDFSSGSILVCGSFTSDTAYFGNVPDSNFLVRTGIEDGFFAKFDTAGNFIWAKAIQTNTGSGSIIKSISTDENGNCFITGIIKGGAFDFDPGPDSAYIYQTGNDNDGFVAKYDAEGNYIWGFVIDASERLMANRILAENGNVFITGSFYNSADFDPGINEAMLTTIYDYPNAFFAKYSNEGEYRFAKNIDSYDNSTSGGYDISFDNSGKIFLTGYFVKDCDFDPGPDMVFLPYLQSWEGFIGIYDSTGNYINAISLYGKNENVPYAITVFNDDIIVTGYFRDTMFLKNDSNYIVSWKTGEIFQENMFLIKFKFDLNTGVASAESQRETINVFPNPAKNYFTIEIPESDPADKDVLISIYNLLGEQILFSGIENFEYQIDMSGQPSGIYFYEIINGKNTFKGKLIIQ